MQLRDISGPADLRRLEPADLAALAAEIRETLITTVARTGGHLGPNLGLVEVTLALHRVFDSPQDKIVFDTGHQAYVHKLVTGRFQDFSTLRQRDGMSGYPSRSESVHDIVENSHASTSLSWIDGIADAFKLLGDDARVVGVIGDGAMTGGMAWEALNNISGKQDRPLVIVINDNGRSYSPTVGGLAHHLSTLRTSGGYEKFLAWGKRTLQRTPVVGRPVFRLLHGLKRGLKDMVIPQGMFQDLGLKYIGPIDGHDVSALEAAFVRARDFGGPVLVHCITAKGRGYAPAEADAADHFHGIGAINAETGKPLKIVDNTWTQAFSDALISIGHKRSDVVAITAAMLAPTGLDRFAEKFPQRTFDVGIAEQHAATSAAGMTFAGLHPVVAVYATFLNRAFDQVLMDCALHRAGVTFVLDRAGVTGDDGASHNGVWDMAAFQVVPHLSMFAPRDGLVLQRALEAATDISDGPSIVRFPKGSLPPVTVAARSHADGLDVLDETKDASAADICIVSIGSMAVLSLDVAARLKSVGLSVRVVDPVRIKPLPASLLDELAGASLVVTIEDGVRIGGVGEAVARLLRDNGITQSQMIFGVSDSFLDHGARAAVLASQGLTPEQISVAVLDRVRAGEFRS